MFLLHFANLGVECLIRMVSLCFPSKGAIQMSPEVAAPFNIATSSVWGFLSAHPLSAFVTVYLMAGILADGNWHLLVGSFAFPQ